MRSKLLAKRFYLQGGQLNAPYACTGYFTDKDSQWGYLTTKTAIGFTSSRVNNVLRCVRGYHAFSPKNPMQIDSWASLTDPRSVIYEVRLYNAQSCGDKYVGTHFKIVRRLTKRSLAQVVAKAKRASTLAFNKAQAAAKRAARNKRLRRGR